MKSVLVTGCAGFIGSHLCERLLSDGYNVIGIDNYITGFEKNIRHLCYTQDRGNGASHLSTIEKDIAKLSSKEMLEDKRLERVDTVIHLASPASPVAYAKYPIETMLANSVGTHNLLEFAKEKKARFLFASTSEVYGDPLVHPQSEDYWGNVNPYGARGMYDNSKRYAESLIWVYRNKYAVNTGIMRFFNTYGSRLAAGDGRVISNFITQALNGEPLTVYGDGSQTRSLCYIDDTINGIMRMVETDVEGAINIGNPDEHTILDIAHTIIRLVKGRDVQEGDIIHLPLPKDDPRQRRPIILKAKRDLNWEPKISLEEGLRRTIAYFRT